MNRIFNRIYCMYFTNFIISQSLEIHQFQTEYKKLSVVVQTADSFLNELYVLNTYYNS